MRTKNADISLERLNPVFTIPLQRFDELHYRLMGNQVVVTSTDTGRHWGSIKKADRPIGWESMTEIGVRVYSDSKHYEVPCDAFDCRRRNPEPDKNSDVYFDDLTKSEQRVFMVEIYKCFPDHIFDIVFSRLCIHVERDPNKPKLDINKTRNPDKIKTDGESKAKINEVRKSRTQDLKPTEIKQYKIVVTELDKMWLYLDRSAVIMGAVNFLTKRVTGFGFFRDKIGVKNGQSILARLLELINALITKMKGTKQ